jgi:nitrogen fixation NifU-like protein
MNEDVLQDALVNSNNLGEMADADAVGTVGSPDCGDMVRMWIKYKEQDGKRVIDRATFQSFGCQTAIAVASLATQLIKGKTREEAMDLNAEELSRPLGPLPPMKIHCGQMVEGALKAALEAERTGTPAAGAGAAGATGSLPIAGLSPQAPTLHDALASAGKQVGKIKIVPLDADGK